MPNFPRALTSLHWAAIGSPHCLFYGELPAGSPFFQEPPPALSPQVFLLSLLLIAMLSIATVLSLAASTAFALSIHAPTEEVHASDSLTITWDSNIRDPSFSIYLVNQAFNDNFGIANNVNALQNSITVTLPRVLAG